MVRALRQVLENALGLAGLSASWRCAGSCRNCSIMKHLFACLALCASLSASAQGDCELFNIQELASENLELHDSIAALNTELDNCGADLSGAFLGDANLTDAYLSGANLCGATMTCLQNGCPLALPSCPDDIWGPSQYICEPDPDCGPNRYRIVLQ